MTIHEVMEATGFSRRTIYYYIQLGLLPPPKGKGKRFEYSEEHVERLKRIRKLQASRYSLKEIKWILENEDSGVIQEKQEEMVFELMTPPEFHSTKQKKYAGPVESIPGESWRRWILAPGVELHFRWPLSEQTLKELESRWNDIFQQLKGGIR